jgi:hypothetical protein
MSTLAPDGVGCSALIKEMVTPGMLKETNGQMILNCCAVQG